MSSMYYLLLHSCVVGFSVNVYLAASVEVAHHNYSQMSDEAILYKRNKSTGIQISFSNL